MVEIGTVIDDKYEILKHIGKGGMSNVYLAMDKRLNKQWAVKEIQKNNQDKNSRIMVKSLIAEANLMKTLDHPSLPRIVDIIDDENIIYVIMDYIEGEPLSKILELYGAQPQELVIKWAKELCDVLKYLHNRDTPIIYRDMKPGNVMLSPNGNLKVIDFGIAREYKEDKIDDTVNLGTKGYAAPEQFSGKGQSDVRTDIYCLGITLYHLVTGHNPSEPPYEIYPIREWNPSLSGGLEKIILKCTALNPDDRYQNCEELLYDLDHYEEIDDKYLTLLKKKYRIFKVVLCLSFFFLLSGILLLVLRNFTIGVNFENILSSAENTTDIYESKKLYIKAIEVKPNDIKGYLGLIDLYKDDVVFSIKEEDELINLVNTNIRKLRNEDDYNSIAFEIGKLYWYYYEYGKGNTSNNQITRMKSSIKWFEDVIKYSDKGYKNYKMSVIYYEIGKFNRDINLNIEEASDKDMYKKYYENIKKIVNSVEDDNEIVNLELYKLAMDSIETYARKFKADSIKKSDLLNLYLDVKEKVQSIDTTTEKTNKIQEYIISRFDSIYNSINNAYLKE